MQQAVDLDEAAAELEGADGRVILMLDEDLAARALRQQRPGDLRRRRQHGMNEGGGFFEGGEIEHESSDI